MSYIQINHNKIRVKTSEKMKTYRTLICILLALAFSKSNVAQERFYNLYPGWTITKVVESNNGYITFGHSTNTNDFEIPPIMNFIDFYGNLIDSFVYSNNDTIAGISTYKKGNYSVLEDYILVSGTYKEYQKDYILNPAICYFNREDYYLDSIIDLKPFFDDKNVTIRFHNLFEDEIHLFGTISFSTENTVNVKSIFCKYNFITKDLYWNIYPSRANSKATPVDFLRLDDGGYLYSVNTLIYSWPYNHVCTILRFNEEGTLKWYWRVPNNEVTIEFSTGPEQFETGTVSAHLFNIANNETLVVWTDEFLCIDYGNFNPYSTIWTGKLDIETSGSEFYEVTNLETYFGDFERKGWAILDSHQDEEGNIFLLLNSYNHKESALMKLDYFGEGEWIRIYRCFPEDTEDNYTMLENITPTSDNGFILAGEFRSEPSNFFPQYIQSAVLLKVDSCGCLTENCDNSGTENYIYNSKPEIFPNPSSETINIIVSNELNKKKIRYIIYNKKGQMIVSKEELYFDKITINISNLVPGNYTLIIMGNSKIYSGKFEKI
jgi:hypothetical protein